MNNSIFQDKIFKIAFVISLATHVFLFIKAPGLSLRKSTGTIEVTYVEEKRVTGEAEPQSTLPVKSQEHNEVKKVKIAKKEDAPNLKKEALKKEKFIQKEKEKQEILVKEAAKDLEELNRLPEFCGYYQRLRSKIRQSVSYPRPFQEGHVLVGFTLLNNGALKEINVVEESSINNDFLRYAAIESVKEASPFEPFPDELSSQEIAFQVFISFETSQSR